MTNLMVRCNCSRNWSLLNSYFYTFNLNRNSYVSVSIILHGYTYLKPCTLLNIHFYWHTGCEVFWRILCLFFNLNCL